MLGQPLPWRHSALQHEMRAPQQSGQPVQPPCQCWRAGNVSQCQAQQAGAGHNRADVKANPCRCVAQSGLTHDFHDPTFPQELEREVRQALAATALTNTARKYGPSQQPYLASQVSLRCRLQPFRAAFQQAEDVHPVFFHVAPLSNFLAATCHQ